MSGQLHRVASIGSISYNGTGMPIIEIQDLNLPGLEPYKTLRRPLEHHRRGIFVAEGSKVVERLLESRLEIVSLLLTPEWLEETRPRLGKLADFPAFVAPKRLLETIVGFHLHQGIMAVAKVPPSAPPESLFANLEKPSLVVAIDGLTNAENLGVLVRNCVAFGVQALVVGETSSSPYLRRAVRNSMGAVFSLPVVPVSNLAATLRTLSSRFGIKTIAAHPGAAQRVTRIDARESCCLVFGSEGEGLSAAVLEACAERAAIPMHDGVDSLNVAVASAVMLYEVRRQRGEEEV